MLNALALHPTIKKAIIKGKANIEAQIKVYGVCSIIDMIAANSTRNKSMPE